MDPYADAIKYKFSAFAQRVTGNLAKLEQFALEESKACNEREAKLATKVKNLVESVDYLTKDNVNCYQEISGLRRELKDTFTQAQDEINSLRAELADKNATIARLHGSPQPYRINKAAPGSRPPSRFEEEGGSGSGSGSAALRAPPRIKRAREEEEEDDYCSYHDSDWSDEEEECPLGRALRKGHKAPKKEDE